MMFKTILLSIFLSLAAMSANAFTPTPMAKPNYEDFNVWLADYKIRAAQAGIDANLMESAFKGQKPNSTIIRLDRNQPHTKTTLDEYLARVVTPERIRTGKALLEQNADLLNEIQAKYGVEKEFVVALWGLETGYGTNTGGFSVINSLMTLSYDGRRREFFEKELLNALKIIQDGHVTEAEMIGSWAGAMGQCQFMPTSFFKYSVDYNGNGKRDFWNTKADVFASISNYLATVGWGKERKIKEKALLDWNKSDYFVASVFKLATGIGYGDNE